MKPYKEMYPLRTVILTIVVLLLTIGTVKCASAEENYLLLGGVSHHFITEDYTNSVHNTVGVSYKNTLFSYFKNSYGNDSFALAYEWDIDETGYFDVKLYTGLVRGYDKCYGKFSEDEVGKDKVEVCGMVSPAFIINVPYEVKPQLTLFGDALTLSARWEL